MHSGTYDANRGDDLMTTAVVIPSFTHCIGRPEENGSAVCAAVLELYRGRIEEFVASRDWLEAIRHLVNRPYRDARAPWSPRIGRGSSINMIDN